MDILKQLQDIGELKENWNENGAKLFRTKHIDFARKVYGYFPPECPDIEVFPTARNSIQYEFENERYYVEIEIFSTYSSVWIMDRKIKETAYYEKLPNNFKGIAQIVNLLKLCNYNKITFISCDIMASGVNFALYSGSFNPPTKGHNHVVKKILQNEKFDFVMLAACNKEFLEKKQRKTDKICYTEEQRIRFLLEITYKNPNVLIYGIEDGYTINVLDKVAETFHNSKVSFVCGSDKIDEIKRWHRNQDLSENYGIIIITRQDDSIEEIKRKASHSFKQYEVVQITKYLTVSATQVREKIKKQENLDGYVCEEIMDILKAEKTYCVN